MLLWFYFLGGSGDEAEPLLQRRDPPVGRSSQARGTVMTIKHHWSVICLVIQNTCEWFNKNSSINDIHSITCQLRWVWQPLGNIYTS